MHEQPVEYVEFFVTGEAALGQFQCSDCNYGVALQRELPRCPMCGGTVWEPKLAAPQPRLH